MSRSVWRDAERTRAQKKTRPPRASLGINPGCRFHDQEARHAAGRRVSLGVLLI